MRKCGCEYHLKMAELVEGLNNWRAKVHKKIKQKHPDHSCDACCRKEYFDCTKNLSTFGDHLCPCGRESNGLRRLSCAKGQCDMCKNARSNFPVCEGEAEFRDENPVKYKWM